MRLHRHIIRATAMLDALESKFSTSARHDGWKWTPDAEAEFREHIETIRNDLRHVDRKLAAFQQITDEVLHGDDPTPPKAVSEVVDELTHEVRVIAYGPSGTGKIMDIVHVPDESGEIWIDMGMDAQSFAKLNRLGLIFNDLTDTTDTTGR